MKTLRRSHVPHMNNYNAIANDLVQNYLPHLVKVVCRRPLLRSRKWDGQRDGRKKEREGQRAQKPNNPNANVLGSDGQTARDDLRAGGEGQGRANGCGGGGHGVCHPLPAL